MKENQEAMMKKKLFIILSFFFFTFIFLFYGCNKDISDGVKGKPIKFGAILPLTGPAASFGKASKNALILASKEINSKNGYPKIELIFEDGKADPKISVSAFNKLYDIDGVRHFITMASGVAMALAPIVEKKKVLLFANASHPEITSNKNYILRYSNTAKDESVGLVSFITDNHPEWKKLQIIALNDDYGRAYVKEIELNLDKKLSIIDIDYYDKQETGFRTITAKVVANVPDLVILIGFGKSLGICIRQLREMSYTGPFITSLGFVLTKDALEVAGDSVKGGFYMNFEFTRKKSSNEFLHKYRSTYGETPAPNAFIDYGTFFILAYGIKEVGSKPENLINFLKNLKNAILPIGIVNVSPNGDIITPVYISPFPENGNISLWK